MEWIKTSEITPHKSDLYFGKATVGGETVKFVLEWSNMMGGCWIIEDESLEDADIEWLLESI